MAASLSYRTFFQHESSRMLFEGALNTDIQKVLSQTETEDDWTNNWHRLAVEDEKKASESEKNGFVRSTYRHYLRSANSYRLAQYHMHNDSTIKKSLMQSYLINYHKAIEHSSPKIEKISFMFEGVEINGYLHLPIGNGSADCIIMIPGLGHSKESMHNWATHAVERGMAVLLADGLGYGETRVLKNVRMRIEDFDRYISTAIDYLNTQKLLNVLSIGILGDCFGGYLSFRSAVKDKRIKGVAITEGILAFGEYQLMKNPMPVLITFYLCESQIPHLEHIHDTYLKCAQELICPAYIVHAKTDKLIPHSLAEAIYDSIKSEKKLVTLHEEICYENYLVNHYNTVLDELDRTVADLFDWFLSVFAREVR